MSRNASMFVVVCLALTAILLGLANINSRRSAKIDETGRVIDRIESPAELGIPEKAEAARVREIKKDTEERIAKMQEYYSTLDKQMKDKSDAMKKELDSEYLKFETHKPKDLSGSLSLECKQVSGQIRGMLIEGRDGEYYFIVPPPSYNEGPQAWQDCKIKDMKEGAVTTLMTGRRNGRDYVLTITWIKATEAKQ